MTARLYNALHDQKTCEVLTCPTDTGSGGYTMRFFRSARSATDLVADRDAIAAWARLTYGWMGRSPDYKASFLGTLGANADFYAPFQDNARHRESQEKVLYWNDATSIRPSIETVRRTKSPTYSSTSNKNEITASSLAARRWSPRARQSHMNFIAHYGIPLKKKSYALICTIPMGAPGMKLTVSVLRDGGRGHGKPVRLSTVRPIGRERHDLRSRPCLSPLGECVRLWRS